MNKDFGLDATDLKIIQVLQQSARLFVAEIGRRVHLSAPAVAERLRRIERAGVITGYHAMVDRAKVGRSILAFVRISATSDIAARVTTVARSRPEVLECHRGTGHDCFIMKVATGSVPALEALIDEFTPFGQVTTSLVLSSPVEARQPAIDGAGTDRRRRRNDNHASRRRPKRSR